MFEFNVWISNRKKIEICAMTEKIFPTNEMKKIRNTIIIQSKKFCQKWKWVGFEWEGYKYKKRENIF